MRELTGLMLLTPIMPFMDIWPSIDWGFAAVGMIWTAMAIRLAVDFFKML